MDIRRTAFRKVWRRLAMIACLLAVCFYLLYETGTGRESFFAIGGVLFGVLLMVGVSWLKIGAMMRESFRSTPLLQAECTVELSEQGMLLSTPISTTDRKWAAFTGFRETQGLFLVSIGGEQHVWLPKRAFTAAQVLEVRALLAAKLAKPGKS